MLLTSTVSCQASVPEIHFFPVKKLGRLIPRGKSSCLSAGIFPRITGNLVVTENSSNKSKWERKLLMNITSVAV